MADLNRYSINSDDSLSNTTEENYFSGNSSVLEASNTNFLASSFGVIENSFEESSIQNSSSLSFKVKTSTNKITDESVTKNEIITLVSDNNENPHEEQHFKSNCRKPFELKTPVASQDSLVDSFNMLSTKKKVKPLVIDSESDDDNAENSATFKTHDLKQYSTPKPSKPADVLFKSCSPQRHNSKSPENFQFYQQEQFTTPRTAASRSGQSRSSSNNYDANSDLDISVRSDSEDDYVNASYENPVLPKKDEIKNKTSPQDMNVQNDKKQSLWPKEIIECTEIEYNMQLNTLKECQIDVGKVESILKTVNLKNLPDGGKALNVRLDVLRKRLVEEESKFEKMVITKSEPVVSQMKQQLKLNWQKIHEATGQVQPQTFGKQALKTFMQQKTLTEDCLNNLHGSLESCPDENTFAENPKGLKIELMPHQKRALAWLTWREKQKPSGGILADDMGLGKTLTLISLVVNSKAAAEERGGSSSEEDSENDENDADSGRRPKRNGGTLVVCPASLINQWEAEVNKHCKRGILSVEVYHGTKRDTRVRRLARHDIVITTYSLAMNEYGKEGPLFGVRWRRIILDEAHVVRNNKSQTSIAVCNLASRSRWALTGTPVHNKELDIFALIKFLRCAPFDDLSVWKRWVNNKNAGGQERLNAVIASIMLRRTKEQLQLEGGLQSLPTKHLELIEVKLDNPETKVYQKMMVFSRTLFAQFLHQRQEKNIDLQYSGNREDAAFLRVKDPNGDYLKMHQKLLQFTNTREVQSHEILVLLLRLRQICCHPHLIKKMIEGAQQELSGSDEDDDHDVADDLLQQLDKLNLEDNDDNTAAAAAAMGAGRDMNLAEAAGRILNLSNPVFERDRRSSKVAKMMDILREKVLERGEKAIIVSQWTSLLHLVAVQLKEAHVDFEQLDGTVPVHKRMLLVNNFNDERHRTRVLLLSLTAGGVGLNLVGANHLMLMDLHWNPQLECQAQDRIYRVGQKRPVHVYKFMTLDTIEERIKALQDYKLQLADSVLTGSKVKGGNKLTMEDLKMLFNM